MENLKDILVKNRPLFEDLVKRKFIYTQTGEIYGGMSGLFDLGPIGCGIKNNVINKWKKHFIVEEDLLEIQCTTLTPGIILRNSGHEQRFIDWMVKDDSTGETFRADHLLEDYIEEKLKGKLSDEEREELDQIYRGIPDIKTGEDFDALIKRFNITNPNNKKNALGNTYAFNLMFKVKVGPLGDQLAYMRPETAQGIFTNFQRLLAFNNGQLPFGGAMIGTAYRNEIKPKNGLLRVREFEMAEIEYFIDPSSKDHPKFESVQEIVIPCYDRESQNKGTGPRMITIKEACEKKIIANQMLGYFIGRIWLFMQDLGVNSKMIRFRQHLGGEMAHYACDCWDTELLSSYGWIECVGLADRSAYDLTAHTKGSGIKLMASKTLEKPEQRQFLECILDKKQIGMHFKKNSGKIFQYFENLSQEELKEIRDKVEKKDQIVEGQKFNKSYIKEWKEVTKTVQEEKFTPNVIEPSFGIGRIIYCLLEQTFQTREDKQRTYFNLNPQLTPYKCVFLPLMRKDELVEVAIKLEQQFRKSGIMCRSDCGSTAIGKRYSRTDEMGIPFAITVDYDTLKDDTVTLREINSMKQIRLPINDLKSTILGFVDKKFDFEDLCKKYKIVSE